MPIRVNIERIEERWTAHAIDIVGCSVTGATRDESLELLRPALGSMRGLSDAESTLEPAMFDIAEVIVGWFPEPGYEVNAFFASDVVPLVGAEIDQALTVLTQSRAALLAAIEGLTATDLHRDVHDGWSIDRVLGHIGRAEWWYLDRLGLAFPLAEIPEDALERLARVRGRLMEQLPLLTGVEEVVERRLELWSPRKIIRRACYHERDHTEHIRKLRALL